MTLCKECGAECPPSKGNRPRKFCMNRCRQRASSRRFYAKQGRKTVPIRQACALCWKLPRRSSSRYCSVECSGLGNKLARLALRSAKLGRDEALIDEEIAARRARCLSL